MDDRILVCGIHESINPSYHTCHLKMLYIRCILNVCPDVAELLIRLLIQVSDLITDAILNIYDRSGFDNFHIFEDTYIENLSLDSKKQLFYANMQDLYLCHYKVSILHRVITLRLVVRDGTGGSEKLCDLLISHGLINLYFDASYVSVGQNSYLELNRPPKTKIIAPSNTCIENSSTSSTSSRACTIL